jgi:hypothetical protein
MNVACISRARTQRRLSTSWCPRRETLEKVDCLIQDCRGRVESCLRPVVQAHCPSLLADNAVEYRKMIELTSKMTLVGLTCTRIAGYRFDRRRIRMASLFGACCFLADSFIDDYGEPLARDYLQRYELLLQKGLFEVRSDREKLFYVVLARLFTERDVLDAMLRQAICGLFLSQKADVELRSGVPKMRGRPRRLQLRSLRECAWNRGGNTITMLSLFLVPGLPLAEHHLVHTAGALFMLIDDHGDAHYDRHFGRLTYMNQVKRPEQTLARIFRTRVERICRGLAPSEGRDLLVAFLYRYYRARLVKNRRERGRSECSWTVYD